MNLARPCCVWYFTMDQEKRRLRQLKRDLKKAGNKTRRQRLKQDLADNPNEAHLTLPTVGRRGTIGLNGMDQDPTRFRRGNKQEPSQDS